jgi:UDP-N-acetylglucosamine 4,6-dehydratase
MSDHFSGKVFITGGTGTLGRAIVQRATNEKWPCSITIYSRSECLQAEMRGEYPELVYVIGDVRDGDRLNAAIAGHDVVLHLAAMKRIPECERQPYECWQTNVAGSHNVVEACERGNVKLCVGISTDKACQAVTMYGASKMAMEKVFQSRKDSRCRFILVRYGNVIQSRGSVILLWRRQVAEGKVPTITDKSMTRFWLTPSQAVDIVLEASGLQSGEVYVPKIQSLPIVDIAREATGVKEYTEIGLRSAERLHEWLVSPDERATEYDDHYLVSESGSFGHEYNSMKAPWLTREQFMAMLKDVGL